jgi:hypothetical protein
VLEQCGRERAVAIGPAVSRFLSGGRRKGDQGVAAGRLHAREPAPELRAALKRGQAAAEILGQRIVAAGIEEDEVGRRLGFHQPDDGVELDRLGGEQELVLEPGIGGDQVVPVIHLQAVARIEEQADLRLVERARELLDGLGEVLLIEVASEQHLEPELLQRLGDVGGVVAGIAQGRGVRVGRVPDHQGDATLGACRLGQQRCRHDSDCHRETGQHGYPLAKVTVMRPAQPSTVLIVAGRAGCSNGSEAACPQARLLKICHPRDPAGSPVPAT